MRKLGSTYQFRISAKKLESGQLNPREKAAVQRAQDLKAQVDSISGDALTASDSSSLSGFQFGDSPTKDIRGEDSYSRFHAERDLNGSTQSVEVNVNDRTKNASVRLKTSGSDGEVTLNSSYAPAKTTGLKGRISSTLEETGEAFKGYAEQKLATLMGTRPTPMEVHVVKLANSAGDKLHNIGDRLGRTSGPDEQHVIRRSGSSFESAVFHNDGSIQYGSTTPDPNEWLVAR